MCLATQTWKRRLIFQCWSEWRHAVAGMSARRRLATFVLRYRLVVGNALWIWTLALVRKRHRQQIQRYHTIKIWRQGIDAFKDSATIARKVYGFNARYGVARDWSTARRFICLWQSFASVSHVVSKNAARKRVSLCRRCLDEWVVISSFLKQASHVLAQRTALLATRTLQQAVRNWAEAALDSKGTRLALLWGAFNELRKSSQQNKYLGKLSLRGPERHRRYLKRNTLRVLASSAWESRRLAFALHKVTRFSLDLKARKSWGAWTMHHAKCNASRQNSARICRRQTAKCFQSWTELVDRRKSLFTRGTRVLRRCVQL